MAINKIETEAYLQQLTISRLMELKTHVMQLKDAYYRAHFKSDPVSATVSGIARETINDINSTIQSIDITTSIPQNVVNENTKKAQSILDNQPGINVSSSNETINSITPNSLGLTPSVAKQTTTQSNIIDAPNAVASATTPLVTPKTDSQLQADMLYDVSGNKSGTNVLDLINNPNREKITALTKACIPCGGRKVNFKLEFSNPFADTLDDLEKKWNALKLKLASLFDIDDEAAADMCELLKFLDAQCLPDLLGLMALLGLMIEKYQNLSLTSWNNSLNMVLAPFLTPVIGSFVTNLDQYVDLIIAPLICVVSALETQAFTIEKTISGIGDAKASGQIKYKRNEIALLEQKEKTLRDRLTYLGTLDNDFNANTTSAEGRTFEKRTATTLVDPDKLFNFNSDFNTTKTVEVPVLIPNKYRTSIDDEKANIEVELRQLAKRKQTILNEITSLGRNLGSKPSTIDSSTSQKIKDAGAIAKGSILQLVGTVNEGISIVKQTIDIYRDELQRIILGRVSTQEDQIEFTRSIQKIQRSLSLVKLIYDLAIKGQKLSDFCNTNSGNAVLSQIAKAANIPNDFYTGTDDNGNSVLVTTPSGATVTVSTINLNPTSGNQIDTITLNNLGNVNQLNQAGVLPNLGNIDGANIQIDLGLKAGGNLDLHFKSSYSIMKNDFCSKSPFNFGSAESVAAWATKL